MVVSLPRRCSCTPAERTRAWTCYRLLNSARQYPRQVVAEAAARAEARLATVVESPAPRPTPPPATSNDGLATPVAVGLGVVLGLSLSWIKKNVASALQMPSAKKGSGDNAFDSAMPDADPEAYQKALARSRQRQCINRAVGYMNAGDPARAVVEIARALQENSCCRSPLLDGAHPKSELLDIYRLHLKHTEVPASFATLLQLQELLGISQAEAEEVEAQVMRATGAFNI